MEFWYRFKTSTFKDIVDLCFLESHIEKVAHIADNELLNALMASKNDRVSSNSKFLIAIKADHKFA